MKYIFESRFSWFDVVNGLTAVWVLENKGFRIALVFCIAAGALAGILRREFG